jgi:hypothetical protein
MRTPAAVTLMAGLLALSVTLQVWRDRGWTAYEPQTPVMWLKATPYAKASMLGYELLAADLYWIRAVVYFGRQRLASESTQTFDLLFPLLDLVTTLDPRFTIAYRFGAIFLAEPPPYGPGRSDLAVTLLERAVERSPDRWEYPHDLGFVYYWHQRDFEKGATWMDRASQVRGAPFWLKSTAASMHSERGDRASARQLWTQIRDGADNDLLRQAADIRIAQFNALEAIDVLNVLLLRFEASRDRMPQSWDEMVAAGLVRGTPLDPAGTPFEIDPLKRTATLSKQSALWPMPAALDAMPRP